MPTASPPLSDDPRWLGRYEVLGRLGAGGQGTVYLARDGSSRVAIKMLHPHLAAEPEVRKRFVREVTAAKQVADFCTARVLYVETTRERPYVVTEYIDGPSLQQQVSGDGPLPEAELRRLSIGMATALTAIHDAGIVHRDFKPGNVLLTPTGPRVIDFGISRDVDGTTTTNRQAIGTPAFMAPEQLDGKRTGRAVDIFAFGGTLVYAATGTAPFGKDSVSAVTTRVLTGDPDLGAMSGDLRTLAAECLRKDPARRPTAQQIRTRLQRPPAVPGPRRSRRVLLATAAGLIGVAGLGGGLLFALQDPGDKQAASRLPAATGQPQTPSATPSASATIESKPKTKKPSSSSSASTPRGKLGVSATSIGLVPDGGDGPYTGFVTVSARTAPLTWTASPSTRLAVSPRSGTLKAGQSTRLRVTADRAFENTQYVTISSAGGTYRVTASILTTH